MKFTSKFWGQHSCDIVANLIDWNIVVSEFELKSTCYVLFQNNIRKDKDHLIQHWVK